MVSIWRKKRKKKKGIETFPWVKNLLPPSVMTDPVGVAAEIADRSGSVSVGVGRGILGACLIMRSVALFIATRWASPILLAGFPGPLCSPKNHEARCHGAKGEITRSLEMGRKYVKKRAFRFLSLFFVSFPQRRMLHASCDNIKCRLSWLNILHFGLGEGGGRTPRNTFAPSGTKPKKATDVWGVTRR
jgi:hypothetical protein